MIRVADDGASAETRGGTDIEDVRSPFSLWLSTQHPLCEPFPLAATGTELPVREMRARRVVVIGRDDQSRPGTARPLIVISASPDAELTTNGQQVWRTCL